MIRHLRWPALHSVRAHVGLIRTGTRIDHAFDTKAPYTFAKTTGKHGAQSVEVWTISAPDHGAPQGIAWMKGDTLIRGMGAWPHKSFEPTHWIDHDGDGVETLLINPEHLGEPTRHGLNFDVDEGEVRWDRLE